MLKNSLSVFVGISLALTGLAGAEDKKEAKKEGDPATLLNAIKGMTGSYGSLSDSSNRSAETQIFYDALAKVSVDDVNSVWAATSKLDDVLGML